MSAPAREAWLGPLLIGTLAGGLLAGRLESAAACLLLGAGLARAAGARRPQRRWVALAALSVTITLALNLYLVAGAPIAALPAVLGRPATWPGLLEGALLALRVLAAGAALLGLAALWPGERGVDALARMVRPAERAGIPVAEGRTVAALALRFRPGLEAEARRIAALQALRAGRPPRGPRQRLARLRALVVPVMTASLERAERVALALDARHAGVREPAAGPPPSWAARLAGLGIALASLVWRGS